MVHQHSRRVVPVVTVFLTAGGKVALFQRSDRVGTYRHEWAGVSGYVERLPLDQAYVELSEETGLSRADVALRGMGVPVLVEDESLGRAWMVHPFLFELQDPRKVTIDWEAERFEWMTPDALRDLHTVPGLDRALEAVWPAFGDEELWSGLAEVATDITHGATSLALAGLEALEAYLERDPDAPCRRAIRAFAACRPSMGVFPHLAVKMLIDHPSRGELARALVEATSASTRLAAEALANYRVILTGSYSSAVRDALVLRSQSGPLEVIVAESRPGLEGVALARDLAKQGIRVSVITDAQAGIFVPQADAVLVGCDAITEDDAVWNKAGTSLLALAAQMSSVPCFAVTQTLKIIPPGFPHPVEEQEPDRVGHCEGVRFRNIIFDSTPLIMLEAVYTENGALTSQQASAVRTYLGAAKLAD